MRENFPSPDYVRQCLAHKDGRVYWLKRPREHFANERAWSRFNTMFAGKEAGCKHIKKGVSRGKRYTQKPRWVVRLNELGIDRHVLVWIIIKGEIPSSELDHKNRDTLDDRIDNLRVATRQQQGQNTSLSSSNTSGYKGVSWSKAAQKWKATIRVNGKDVHLGVFGSAEQASLAYKSAAQEHFGEFMHA